MRDEGPDLDESFVQLSYAELNEDESYMSNSFLTFRFFDKVTCLT